MGKLLFTGAVSTWGLIILLGIIGIAALDAYLFYERFKVTHLDTRGKNETNEGYFWPSVEFSLFTIVGYVVTFIFISICLSCLMFATRKCLNKEELLEKGKKTAYGDAGGSCAIPCACLGGMLMFCWCGPIGFLIYALFCIISNVCFTPFGTVVTILTTMLKGYKEPGTVLPPKDPRAGKNVQLQTV